MVASSVGKLKGEPVRSAEVSAGVSQQTFLLGLYVKIVLLITPPFLLEECVFTGASSTNVFSSHSDIEHASASGGKGGSPLTAFTDWLRHLGMVTFALLTGLADLFP